MRIFHGTIPNPTTGAPLDICSSEEDILRYPASTMYPDSILILNRSLNNHVTIWDKQPTKVILENPFGFFPPIT